MLAFLILLPVRLAPLPCKRKQQMARRVIRELSRLYILIMVKTGPLELTVEGIEKLQTPGAKLIIANHPTLIDAVVLISLIPEVTCIVKSQLTQSLFMREIIQITGYIPNSDPRDLLEDCNNTIRAGRPLLLFPEGTRSTPGKPLTFLRGAAQIALRVDQDLTPVVITCSPPALLKGQKWYQVPKCGPVRMIFQVFDDIPTAPFQCTDGGISRRSRKLTAYLTDYFHQHLH